MTLLDATNVLLDYLSTSDTITEEVLDSIHLGDDTLDESARIGILFAAIDELVKSNVLVEIDEFTWMLVEPLGMRGQTVHLSTNTATAVAMIINAWLDAQDAQGARSNALNITEVDIIMMYNILGNILEMDTKRGEQANTDPDEDSEEEDGPDFGPGQFGGPNDGAN